MKRSEDMWMQGCGNRILMVAHFKLINIDYIGLHNINGRGKVKLRHGHHPHLSQQHLPPQTP